MSQLDELNFQQSQIHHYGSDQEGAKDTNVANNSNHNVIFNSCPVKPLVEHSWGHGFYGLAGLTGSACIAGLGEACGASQINHALQTAELFFTQPQLCYVMSERPPKKS